MWNVARNLFFEADAPTVSGYVLASIFRPAFIRALVDRRHMDIVRELGLLPLAEAGATKADLYELVYDHLHKVYRCEYVYKNEILHKLFLSRHDPSRATVTSEFFVGNNRLDLLVINGTTVAYEIKTGYDNLERLATQTAAYLTVFDRVNIVCDPAFVERAKSLVDERVGVFSLTSQGTLRIERPWISNANNVDPSAIFELLRAPEYVRTIRRQFGVVLNVPNTERRRVHLEYFRRLSPSAAHEILVNALRVRFADRQPELVKQIPPSMVQMYFEVAAPHRSRLFDINSLRQPLL
jgi:hypothetical protein